MVDGLSLAAIAGLGVGTAFVIIISVMVLTGMDSGNDQNNSTTLIVEVKPYNRTSYPDALSVYVNQRFVLSEPSDSFYVYEISSLDYEPPSSIRAVYDEEGNRIKLRSYGLTHDLDERTVACPSGENRTIMYNDHGMPLASNITGTIFYKYPFAILLPPVEQDDDNNLTEGQRRYSLQFASFYDAKIVLPQGAEIQSMTEEKCPVSGVGNFTDAFFYDVEFSTRGNSGNETAAEGANRSTTDNHSNEVTNNATMYVRDRTSDASLPIRVLQKIELAEQTVKVRVYPIYPEWNLSDIASEDPRFGTFTDENDTRLYADFGLAPDVLPFAKVTCPSANSVLVKNMNLGQPFNITLFNSLRDERNVTGIISFTDPISPYLEEERGGVNGAVFYNYRLPGVNPTASYQNGTDSYRLMFASFYDVDIRLPRNAIVTSSHVEECSFADSDHWMNREFAAMNVYDVVFSISADDARANDNNNSTASIGVNITEIPQRLAASMQGLSSADRVAVEEANKLDIVQAYLGRFPEAEVNSVQHQNMYSAGPEPIGAIHTISYSYGYADETSKFRHFRSLHVTLIEEAGQSMPARTSLACGSSLGGSALAQLNSVNSTEQVKTLCPLPYE